MKKIEKYYTHFYKSRNPERVYPTEFVVRTFLASYPNLCLRDKVTDGSRVLDLSVGDGRNTVFLAEQGYDVYGTEITEEIVELALKRLHKFGLTADLRLGRNGHLPFHNEFFDCVLASHSFYYVDKEDIFEDNLKELSRVLKLGGWFVGSMPDKRSYIFKNGTELEDGLILINSDPYKSREGYKLRAFSTQREIEDALSPYFDNFSFGKACNDYYGIDERVFWVACQRKQIRIPE